MKRDTHARPPGALADDIWVFMDLRSPRLFGFSLNVLDRARELSEAAGWGVTACLLAAPGGAPAPPRGGPDGCLLAEPAAAACGGRGADRVLVLENEAFEAPRADRFSAALADAAAAERPRLLLFALTDFGRELAARTAARLRAGLIADCQAVRIEAGGVFVGTCPAWGGAILSEITFAEGWGTGIATLDPHGGRAAPPAAGFPPAELVRRPVPAPPAPAALTLSAPRPAPAARRGLEAAEVVVVGGAGLGSARGFGKVRELAAALGGEVGATRPPVVQHWAGEERLIGQTGKRVAPKLLISVGASGAPQYTAGILDAETIVAIDRDPTAPIFQFADVGVAADAHALLPVLTARAQAAAMRRLADALGEAEASPEGDAGFGGRLQKLRAAHGLAIEALAEATGQTPDFIAQVEAGGITPPVAFLLRLAAAFQVDPGAFLRREEQAAIRDRRLESYVRRTQNYSYRTLTDGAPSDHLRAFMVTIEPQQAHKPVAYKHEGEEFIFVVAGELEVTLGEKARVLKAGEHLHFNSFTPHRLKNLSAGPTRCLVVLYTL